MQSNQLWYTRRGHEIRGPFPAQQISRFILLGRIQDTDELSVDQHNWQCVTDVPVVIPAELKADLSDPKAREALLIARMREDERNARDRRAVSDENRPPEERRRRSSSDRRSEEEEVMLRHREVKTAIAEAAKLRNQNYFLRGIIATLLLVAIITAAWVYQPWLPWQPKQDQLADCNAMPQPWVNYSNCLMEGIKLAGVDLRGSRLRNTNLGSADLRGSQFGGADLAYSNLVAAQLSSANLNQAVLVGANLRNATLVEADMSNANLAYAVLQGADMRGAILINADLRQADLQNANLGEVNLNGAMLDNAIWVDGVPCQPGSVGTCKR
jgi:uncharacterized protein YjbI with pentapeptide repeats